MMQDPDPDPEPEPEPDSCPDSKYSLWKLLPAIICQIDCILISNFCHKPKNRPRTSGNRKQKTTEAVMWQENEILEAFRAGAAPEAGACEEQHVVVVPGS